jgi:hypothetical protein
MVLVSSSVKEGSMSFLSLMVRDPPMNTRPSAEGVGTPEEAHIHTHKQKHTHVSKAAQRPLQRSSPQPTTVAPTP